MASTATELGTLAAELRAVIHEIAAKFGSRATATVDGDRDCGSGICWQYGVHVDAPVGAAERLHGIVARTLERAGWRSADASDAAESLLRFSRNGAQVNVHVARATGDVAIVGSTRCVPD